MALRYRLATGLALLTAALVPSVAAAGFTTWAAPAGEPTILEILDDTYGLDNLERMHDFGASETDEVWINRGQTSVSIIAKYSPMAHRLGIFAGESGKSYAELLTVRGAGRHARAEASFDVTASSDRFRFVHDPDGDHPATSRMADNHHGHDQMISWRVIGNDGRSDNVLGSMVIAFEEETSFQRTADYNDLVIEVRHTAGGDPDDTGAEPVPEPATLILIGMGAAGLAASRRRKR